MMIEVKDRISTHPGRVKMTPVAGESDTYDMVRADSPIETGTPINKALFQSIGSDIDALRQRVDDKLFEISQRTKVGNLIVGAEIGLRENGVLVPFILINQNNPTGRVTVMRKNCIIESTFMDAGETYYEDCKIDRWLNNEYLSSLDELTQSVITAVTVNATTSQGNRAISRKVYLFSLDAYNYNYNTGYETFGGGSTYFTEVERRIALLNGVPTNHWTRSHSRSSATVAYITPSGSWSNGSPTDTVAGVRPVLTLPIDFEVTISVPSTENVMAAAEVI